jgi:hypothetical protein
MTLGATSHRCHWIGCSMEILPRFFCCRAHWHALPKPIRREIWHHYRAGQEVRKNPSPEYIAAARAALNWIAENQDQR